MLKRFILALGIIAGALAPAYGAGTISFSLSQQFGADGKPLGDCFLYTIQAGTVSTPQNAFQDSALTIPQPNPMRCDASGRLPQFFLADGSIKVRLTDKNGVNQNYPNGAGALDNILVIGPSSGGGGGSPVDPTTVLQTGDLKPRYGTGVHAGWVRANGRTIGSATSGATERANADVQALFEYLWTVDPNLSVSGGRGVSAAADWAANKTLALPDYRGRAMAGLDGMGNIPAGRLTIVSFGSGGDVLGDAGGVQTSAILQSDLPNTGISVTATGTVVNISNFLSGGSALATADSPGSAGGFAQGQTVTNQAVVAVSGSTGSINGGVAQTNFIKVQPTMLATIYLKL